MIGGKNFLNLVMYDTICTDFNQGSHIKRFRRAEDILFLSSITLFLFFSFDIFSPFLLTLSLNLQMVIERTDFLIWVVYDTVSSLFIRGAYIKYTSLN